MHRTLTTLAAILLLLGAATAHAEEAFQGGSVFKDPEWQRRFLGSYGFLSGAEPKPSEAELMLLREVLELIKTNPKAAAAMLQNRAGAGSSASVDFVLANLYFQNGRLKSAAQTYRKAIKKFPDFRRAHKNLGLVLVQVGQYRRGAEHLSRAIELGERDGRAFGLLGYCYLNLEDHLAAEQAYRNAILQEPDVRDWKLGLARSLLAISKYEEAVALFDGMLAENPDDADLWMLQANGYLGLDQPLAAAVNLEAVRAMGAADTSGLVLLGDIYMNAGKQELAKSAYLEVIEKDAKGTAFETAARAADLLVRTRAYGDAKELLASIDRRYGKTLSNDDQLRLLTLQAKVARAEGRKKEAAELLESIVERDGTRGEALLELASYYQGEGDTERALLIIERAERLEKFEYKALLAHAQFRVTERDYRKAAELLRRALQINQEPRVERFLARVEASIRQ